MPARPPHPREIHRAIKLAVGAQPVAVDHPAAARARHRPRPARAARPRVLRRALVPSPSPRSGIYVRIGGPTLWIAMAKT